MNLTQFFGLLGGLLVLAFVANRLARWTRVPDVLVLIATGTILGPVLHWIDTSKFQSFAHGFGTFALILILFEAGMDLNIRDTLRHFPGGILLAIFSFALSLAGIAAFLVTSQHMAKMPALLAAAAFACISSSVILPVLEHLDLRPAVRTTLVVEAALSDALGVLTVGILLELTSAAPRGGPGTVANFLIHSGIIHGTSGSIAVGVVSGFLVRVLISIAVAYAAGFVWVRALPLLSEQRFWQVLTLAAVLLVYAASDAVGGSNLFSVVAFGATLANLPGEARKELENAWGFVAKPSTEPTDSDKSRDQLLLFHSELAFLVRTFFFVLLGSIVPFQGMRAALAPSVGIVGVLIVSRWLAVQLSRVAWRGLHPVEIEVAVLLIPRGLITAVLAFEIVDAHGTEFAFLPNYAFGVILITCLQLLVGTFRARSLPPSAPKSIPAAFTG
jgi:cell volume regulation protein A